MHRYTGESGGGIKEYLQGVVYVEESLKYFSQISEKSSLSYALAISRLGNLHRTLGNYSKAERLINESQTIYDAKLPAAEEVTNFNEIKGQLLRDQGQYSEALTTLNACKQAKVNHHKHPVSILWTESFIGNIYVDLGCYEQAQALLKKVLTEFLQYFSKESSYYGWALANLGAAYVNTDILKAKQQLEEALGIYERLTSNHQVIYKTILPNLVRIYIIPVRLKKPSSI